MRLIKAQNTNLRNIYGKGIKYDTNDKVTVDSANVMRVPKGTTAQYTTTPEDGDLRFNTDKSEFEIVSNGGTIASIRTTAPGTNPGIVQQSLGNADGSSTIYGPLDNQDTVFPNPLNAQNILVFLENVFQISTTNYTTVQNPTATGTGAEVDATALTQDIEYIITDPGNTDFTLIGAADSNTGTVFTANASNTGVGTGKVRITGFYLDFTSAPPAAGGQGQTIPITVLHNFDK